MTVNELTMIWAKIKALFVPKSELTTLNTQVTNLNTRLNQIYPEGSNTISSSKLPSYVDDVIEGSYRDDVFYNPTDYSGTSPAISTQELTPETGKIYVNTDPVGGVYRWSGTQYIEIVDEPDLTNYYTKTESDDKYVDRASLDGQISDSNDNPVTGTTVYSYLTQKYTKIVYAVYDNSNMYALTPGIDNMSGSVSTEPISNPDGKTLYLDPRNGNMYCWYKNVYHRISGSELTQSQIDNICTLS